MPGIGIIINREFLLRFARFAYTCLAGMGLYHLNPDCIPLVPFLDIQRYGYRNVEGYGYIVSDSLSEILWNWTSIGSHPRISMLRELTEEDLNKFLRDFLQANGFSVNPSDVSPYLITFDSVDHSQRMSEAL